MGWQPSDEELERRASIEHLSMKVPRHHGELVQISRKGFHRHTACGVHHLSVRSVCEELARHR